MPSIGKSYKSNLERAQFGMVEIFPGACPERKISRHFVPRNDKKRRGRNDKIELVVSLGGIANNLRIVQIQRKQKSVSAMLLKQC